MRKIVTVTVAIVAALIAAAAHAPELDLVCETDTDCYLVCVAINPPHPTAPDYACDGNH